jgi:uncharacterized protein YodC (DUF2158 family)
MEQKFVKGELVRHKATDFKMVVTVTSQSAFEEIACRYWSESEGIFKIARLYSFELEKVSEHVTAYQ